MDNLSEFVDEQIRKGANPSDVKVHLLKNGWKEDEVEHAVRGAVNRKIRKRVLVAAVGIIIVGLLVFSLLSLAKNTKPEPLTPSIPPTSPSTPNVDLGTQTPNAEGCSFIESSIEKDACYKQLLKGNYDCKKLNDKIELTYCSRAYEELMLKGVEAVEEN